MFVNKDLFTICLSVVWTATLSSFGLLSEVFTFADIISIKNALLSHISPLHYTVCAVFNLNRVIQVLLVEKKSSVTHVQCVQILPIVPLKLAHQVFFRSGCLLHVEMFYFRPLIMLRRLYVSLTVVTTSVCTHHCKLINAHYFPLS